MFDKLLSAFKKKSPSKPPEPQTPVRAEKAAPVSIDKPMYAAIQAVWKQDHMAASAHFGEALRGRSGGGLSEPLNMSLRTVADVVQGFRGGSPMDILKNHQSFLIQCFSAQPMHLRKFEPANLARFAHALWMLQYLYWHCKQKGHEYALERIGTDHGFMYSTAMDVLTGIGMTRAEINKGGIRPLDEEPPASG